MDSKKNLQFGTVFHISDIYENRDPNSYSQEDRYESVQKRFAQKFGEEPSHFVRVPGSLHLFIGLKEKLSMNIEKDIIFAFKQYKLDKIVIASSQSVYYPTITLETDPAQKIPSYELQEKLESLIKAFLIGYKCALQNFNDHKFVGFRVLISVDELQTSQGFGFHSAITIGATMITLFLNSLTQKMNKIQVLENLGKLKIQFCQKNLNHEEVQLNSVKDCLQYSDSNFLQFVKNGMIYEIQYPFMKDYVFIISDSLYTEPKILASQKKKSLRKAEILLTIKLLRKKLNLKEQIDDEYQDLIQELQDLLDYSDEEMIQFIKTNIEEQPYNRQKIEQELGEKLDVLLKTIPYSELLLGVNTQFYLQHPLLYRFQESLRTKSARQLLKSQEQKEQIAQQLGKLMNESYEEYYKLLSLQGDELNSLYSEIQKYNVYGTKIIETNNGLSLITLVRKDIAPEILQQLQSTYYTNPQKAMFATEDLSYYTFITAPSMGSVFLDPQYEIWF